MDKIIEIKNLSKSFNDLKAVDNISFCVKKGELFAFLGENGAGKSTTIKMITGTLEKTSGEIFIDNLNINDNFNLVSKKIGVVFQNSLLDKVLSVKDNLKIRASLYGIYGEEFNKRLEKLSSLLDFKNYLDRPVGKLSGGMARRIDVARSLIHDPEILILDEPTTGLDPNTRRNLWNVINTLRKEKNMTVFLTTHYMEEVADSDYVVILDDGKIKEEGTVLDLKNKYAKDYITLYNISEEDVKKIGIDYIKIRNAYKIIVNNTKECTDLIIKYKDIFKDYEVIKGNMDDVFLSVTGKDLEGGNN